MDMRYVAWAGYQLAPAESVSSVGHGSIEIEPGWQLISIPVHYGYWDSSSHEHVWIRSRNKYSTHQSVGAMLLILVN